MVCVLVLAGCASGVKNRIAAGWELAQDHGWTRQIVDAGPFDLAVFHPPFPARSDTLSVYIEGDGLAWITPYRPSTNPTPRHPVGLLLATLDPSGAVAYLARPCQYVKGVHFRGCSTAYWTSDRFAPEVIDASMQALDRLKAQSGASKLTLVGYSGGGAVATLLAERRHDVVKLITVAGNLDHEAWTKEHDLTPLRGSLNPYDAINSIRNLDQTHFIGGADRILPPATYTHLQNSLQTPNKVEFVEIANFDHACCWTQNWHALLDYAGRSPARPHQMLRRIELSQ